MSHTQIPTTQTLTAVAAPGSRLAGCRPTGRVRAGTATALLLAGLLLAGAAPASAHGEGETAEGYVLVQQALGHLAHDTSRQGVMLAMEKVDDALATQDQEGVNVAELTQAQQALDAGRVAEGRDLLGKSIDEALSSLPPATGEQTGTRLVPGAMSGRGDLRPGDWGLVVGGMLMAALGLLLAFRYRPTQNVPSLRAQLGAQEPRPHDEGTVRP